MSTWKIVNEIKTARSRAPSTVKGTVPPGRLPNTQYRIREYLTEREVERLMKAAGNNRHGHRDATMILMAFRHGLRASELCSLRWDQADLVYGRLHVNRLKNGIASVHPLTGIELRALRRLQREQKPGRYIFVSERGAPMSAVAFRRMVTRLGPAAMMPFPIHPHMLRHSTGFKLANQGVDTRSLQHYLGYKNIQHTVDIASFLPSGSEISGRTRERLADESILGAWMVDLKDQGLSETAMNDGVAKEVADEEARC